MINLYVVLGIIFLHWVFDFVLQTEEQAQKKSTSLKYLLEHTGIYSLYWYLSILILGLCFNAPNQLLLFPIITFFAHTATDYYTSRVNSHLAEKARVTGEWNDFFASVGFDQFLHYCQLFLTYYLLTK